jgi:hypothetical protein
MIPGLCGAAMIPGTHAAKLTKFHHNPRDGLFMSRDVTADSNEINPQTYTFN